jgi:ABC-type glycerol-3-phosphate transport system permease component
MRVIETSLQTNVRNSSTNIARQTHRRGRDVLLITILSGLGFLTFFPVLMLIELSFKTQQQMANSMWLPTLPLRLVNYFNAWVIMNPFILNSVLYVIGTITVSIVCSTLSAYAMARYAFPGREFFYIAILALLMIPGILTLITRYVTAIDLHINNTFLGVWLPMAAGAQPFQIIVMRTFLASLPEDYFEAGRLDGASELRMLLDIAIPLSMPILSTLVLLQVLSVWNEYIWPIMIFSNPERYPVMLGVLQLGNLIRGGNPGDRFAGYVIAGLPLMILFALSSRSFIRGLTSGAIKM